jgi:hypothetical protein
VVKGREWFQDRSCSMPQDDDALIAELTSPTVVQSKADMKKRGMRSPDLAFLFTFACSCAGSLIVKGSQARARAWLAAANLGASHTSALQRFFQLSLRDQLLPKCALAEPFKGFHPGCQLLHLCGYGF